MSSELISLSKFLSLILRHKPETVGIELDSAGWTDVDVLLRNMRAAGRLIDLPLLQRLVYESDKQRFTFSEDGTKIRANQGHSAQVDLRLPRAAPPSLLFHGTATRFAPSISASGLKAGTRTHVHLSADAANAQRIGERHGKPVVLIIEAARMHAAGHVFNVAQNGVWLVSEVPPEYIQFPDYEI